MVQGSEPKFGSAQKQGFQLNQPIKKPAFQASSSKSSSANDKHKSSKDYGAWGSTFKNQSNFKDMHMY